MEIVVVAETQYRPRNGLSLENSSRREKQQSHLGNSTQRAKQQSTREHELMLGNDSEF